MTSVVRVKSNLCVIKQISQQIRRRIVANVGIIDNPEIAQYAVYNGYGWVQRVTPRQAGFFRHNFGINLKPNNTLMSPPRPFFRATIRAKRREWEETMSKSIKSVGIDVSVAEGLAVRLKLIPQRIVFKENKSWMSAKFFERLGLAKMTLFLRNFAPDRR